MFWHTKLSVIQCYANKDIIEEYLRWLGLPWWLRWYRICLQCGRPGFDPWVGKSPWRRAWQPTPVFMGFLGGSDGTESACSARDLDSIPGLRKSPGGGHGSSLQYSGLENPHGQRSLAGYSPWGCKESDTTEPLSTAQGSNPCPQESEGKLYQTSWISCPKFTFHNLTFNSTKTIFKAM